MNGFTFNFTLNQSNPPQKIQIKVTEDDISGYISLLEQMKNNDKNNSELIAKIDLDCLKNRMKTALIFSEIILKLGVDNSIINLSLKWICKIFTPQTSVSQNDILHKWSTCDPETKEKIKDAIFKGLSFNDPQILSLTSLALSSLLNIDKTQSDILTKLHEIYENQSSSNLTKSAAINALAEICREKLLNGYSEQLNIITKEIYEKIIEYFTSDITTQTIDIRFNLTAAIDTFVEPELIKKNINKVKKSIFDNLQNIPANKPADSIAYPEQLHYKLLSVLFKIICLVYNSKDEVSDAVICDLLKQVKHNGIDNHTIEQLKENGFDGRLLSTLLGSDYNVNIILKMLKQGLKLNFLKHAFNHPLNMWRHMLQDGEASRLKGQIISNMHNDGVDDIDDIENEFQIFENIIRFENGPGNNFDNSDSDSNDSNDDDEEEGDDDVKDVIDESFNLILKQILEFNGSETNQFIISNLLQFLNSLIKFENKKVQKNLFKNKLKNVMLEGVNGNGMAHYDVKEEKIRNLCKIELDQIINKLFSILRMIDQDDTNIDDSNAVIPSKYSLLCLQSYFRTNPSEIFLKLKKYWTEEMKDYFNSISNPQQKSNWVDDYAFILSISVLCPKTSYSDDIKSSIQSFLCEPIGSNFSILKDFIVCKCLIESKIPKILHACLSCLSEIFNVYSDFLNDDIYDLIFNWINQNKEIEDPAIFNGILNLISSIFKEDTPQLNESISIKLISSFNNIVELFQIGLRRTDLFEKKKLYSMMAIVVDFALKLNDASIDENISKLIDSQILILKENPSNVTKIVEEKITNSIHFLYSIFMQEGMEKFSHFLEEIIKSCFILMDPKMKFFQIFENSMLAFSAFVTFLDEDKIELIKKMNEYALLGLSSGNPKITAYSSLVCCKVYHKIISSKFSNYTTYLYLIPNIYDSIIESCLTYFDITKENYSILIDSIDILLQSNSLCNENENHDFVSYVISFFNNFAKMPVSIKEDDEKDIQKANKFYSSMFHLAFSIINCSPIPNLMLIDQIFDEFVPDFLKKMKFNISDQTLEFFCSIVEACFRNGDGRVRSKLTKNTNLVVLYHGLCIKKPSIELKAHSLLKLIT